MRMGEKRNYGVDAARILAIFLVVLQHVVFLGGLDNDGGMFRRLMQRVMEASCQCCVPLFGLITGYVCVRVTKWNWRRLIELWLQVWMTGLLVLGATALIGCSVTSDDWLRALFPIWFDEYWYFTGYVVVFLLMPYLNRLPHRNVVSLALFLVVSAFTCWPGGLRCLPLAKGYSAAWLVILFLFGGTLREIETRWTIRPIWCFLFAGAMVGITVAQRLALSSVPALRELFADEWTLLPYTSPTTVLVGAALLLGLSRLDFGEGVLKKAIAVVSPCAFGVYLFHVQPTFFDKIWKGSFITLNALPDLAFVLSVPAVAALVFLGCFALEFVRRKLTKRARFFLLFLFTFFMFTSPAVSWEAVALTPSLIQLTGDDLAAERARYERTGPSLFARLTGWKLNLAIDEAARKAQEPRKEILRQLRAAHSNVWHEAIGQTHVKGPDGAVRDVRAADVAFYVWLPLDHALTNGESMVLALGTGDRIPFTYDAKAPSPLFKINQVGYVAKAREKYAYLGAWLGTGGAFHLPFDAKNPPAFELRDAASDRVVFTKKLKRRMDDPMRDGVPWTGEEVWEMDFSSVTNAGSYYLSIAGIGRSDAFRIAPDAAEDALRVHLLGMRHLRCGVNCHQCVRRGVFPPDDHEYSADENRGCGFFSMGGKSLDVNHFRLIADSASRAGEEVVVPGGWHDAADYDRRPYHLAIVDDFVAVARERPDLTEILDEAEWGLRHLRAAQQVDGGVGTWIETTRHPRPGEGATSEKGLKYYLSRATRSSSLEYAASAAAFAVVARDNGRKDWSAWAESARRAWEFAQDTSHDKLVLLPYGDTMISYRPSKTLPPDALFKAGFNLLLLGDNSTNDYEAVLTKNADAINAALSKPYWRWSPLKFLEVEKYALRIPDALDVGVKEWQNVVMRTARECLQDQETSYPYRTPWHPSDGAWAHSMAWGTSHPFNRGRFFVAAHILTGLRQWLDALSLCNDFHNGANPEGVTLTSGLGIRPTKRYLDLDLKYGPGITPYRWTFGVAPIDRELVHSDAEVRIWPYWRRYCNIEAYTIENSEFSGLETIGPAVVGTAYLTPHKHNSLTTYSGTHVAKESQDSTMQTANF